MLWTNRQKDTAFTVRKNIFFSGVQWRQRERKFTGYVLVNRSIGFTLFSVFADRVLICSLHFLQWLGHADGTSLILQRNGLQGRQQTHPD